MTNIFDGAMGTMLQLAGLPAGYCPELWNLEYPEKITAVHRQYVENGADIIETNTFGANKIKLKHYGLQNKVEEINIAAVQAARAACGPTTKVAGSVGPTGKFIAPMGDLSFDDEEWTLSLQVEVPIFEGGRKIAKMSRTRSQFDAEKSRYDDTIRSIKTLVEQSALALQEEQRNLEIAVEAETVAKENHERFLNLYEEGLADSLDVTQALTELVEAQTNVVSTRYGYLRVYAQLLSALGLIPTEESPYGETEWLATLK